MTFFLKGVMACAWIDKKPVMVMSSCCRDPIMTTTVTRRMKGGSKENVPCPLAVRCTINLWENLIEATSYKGITKSCVQKNVQVHFLVLY